MSLVRSLAVSTHVRDFLMPLHAVIESISNYREPQQFEAVYILMPTTQNVERVIKDFSNDQQQYLAAHLFFIEGASVWGLEHCR